MSDLLTSAELGNKLRLDAKTVEKLRVKNKWPHVRLSRWDVRYTPEQAEQIVAQHTVTTTAPKVPAGRVPGQTARSAARKRAS